MYISCDSIAVSMYQFPQRLVMFLARSMQRMLSVPLSTPPVPLGPVSCAGAPGNVICLPSNGIFTSELPGLVFHNLITVLIHTVLYIHYSYNLENQYYKSLTTCRLVAIFIAKWLVCVSERNRVIQVVDGYTACMFVLMQYNGMPDRCNYKSMSVRV